MIQADDITLEDLVYSVTNLIKSDPAKIVLFTLALSSCNKVKDRIECAKTWLKSYEGEMC